MVLRGAAEASSIPFPVELGLTLLHTALYAGLFFFAYLQLWLLLYYREKRLSYRTVCLFLCLLWAALRTVLFSFCLQDSLQATRLRLQPFPHWLLFCFPVCLLFATGCLLSLYFAEVIFKVKCAAEFNKYKALLYMGSIFTSLTFIFVNLTCALLVRDGVPEKQLRWTVFTRALINDSLFILCAVLLACCMCKLAKMSSANVYLESKCKPHVVSCGDLAVFRSVPSNCEKSTGSGWYGSLVGSDNCVMVPPLAAPSLDGAPLLFAHGALEPRNHSLHLTPPQN
ncbi:hypothetical protein lerEdw1_007546 [Lerista edwardsae]|nr:hypothetical protein lerEdw1_007546 [Lerista edwardsae]